MAKDILKIEPLLATFREIWIACKTKEINKLPKMARQMKEETQQYTEKVKKWETDIRAKNIQLAKSAISLLEWEKENKLH